MRSKPNRDAWIKGGNARCDVEPEILPRPIRLVLLGAPGIGKSTQAELLAARIGACHLSTGDIFRAAKSLLCSEFTTAMTRAMGFVQRGDLVPDEIVLSIVTERGKCLQCGGGFLLDGFPRTIAQAEALRKILAEKGLNLDAVLSYELPLEMITTRLSGRRTCPRCQRNFHVEARSPKRAGICDDCGIELSLRDDDRPEAIRVRMEAYENSTAPLMDFYRRKGLLIPILAGSTPEETYERTLRAIQSGAKL